MVNSTTVSELTGIKMAAINGESVPWTAKNNPIILYKKEIKKLRIIILILILENFKKFGKFFN